MIRERLQKDRNKKRENYKEINIMSSYAIGRTVGIFLGILIGLIICFIAFKVMNKNGKIKTEYDERQNEIRGLAYKYGFWTTCGYLGILFILSTLEVDIPITTALLYFIGFVIGAMVVCVYSILKGAYFGLNNIQKRWYIFMAFFMVFNFVVSFVEFKSGDMIIDGKLDLPFVNFICGVMFLIIFVTTYIKKSYDNKQESEIEE